MLTGLPALEATDWSRLHHAYGRATDTPGHLRALLQEDRESRKQAMLHLWSAIIHQGTPWTATGPAALVVAGLLFDERIDRGEPVRANLLSFLVSVAEAPKQVGWNIEELLRLAALDIEPLLASEDDEALFGDEDAANSFYARSLLGCISAAPVLMKVMLESMDNALPRVRAYAAMGAVTLAKNEWLRGYAKDAESRLLALARAAQTTDERCAHVLALGDLGFSPVGFLQDQSPAVRMCAALAPSLATDDAAIGVLLNTLEHHAGSIDAWFLEKPPQFAMRPRFPVVARLIQQVSDFDRLANAAIAVVGVTEKFCVDYDWGQLLVAAFPNGFGFIRTPARRRFLCALVKNKELWDPTLGNAFEWFKQVGLPFDREACAKRVEEA
jgi:hypothetical protein